MSKAKTTEADTAAEFKPLPPLSEDRWSLEEHRDPGHWSCVPVGTTIEQLLEPSYWANVARNFRPRQSLTVHWDDGSQLAWLYVIDCGRNWLQLGVVMHKEIVAAKRDTSRDDYDVAFNGPVDLFRITRRSDRAVIKAGFATEADAVRFLADYKRKLAA